MPGYIIHLSEAEMILEALQKKGFLLDETWKNLFRLGSLLPDTKRKREKVTSHFWSEDSMEDLAIPPVLYSFEEIYREQLRGPLMWGYWAHLHLDEIYVEEFWPSMMEFLDEENQVRRKRSDIRWIHLLKKDSRIPVDEFFSSAYYYGDFDRSNLLLYKKYKLTIPSLPKEPECPVREVEISDLSQVLSELREMLLKTEDTQPMKVFDLQELEGFLMDTALRAADRIETDLKQ